jgi:chemotaxis protein methyltransferase CheR
MGEPRSAGSAPVGRGQRSPSDRRRSLAEADYQRLGELVRSRYGMHLTDAKKPMIETRLQRHLDANGFASLADYLDHVVADPTSMALDALASMISTHHTYFFREPAHFDYLRTRALPDLEHRLRQSRSNDLRVWCAAAATGEEAYSLLITLLEHFGHRYHRLHAGVLATDISTTALAHAASGVYTEQQVELVPAHLRRRYFRRLDDGHYALLPHLRDDVLFRRFNLKSDVYPFKQPFHIIFCRNVMIYFDQAMRERLVEQLWRFTAPGGYLFLGHAESIDRADGGFQRLGPAVYRRLEREVS